MTPSEAIEEYGNKTLAAAALGISRHAFRRREQKEQKPQSDNILKFPTLPDPLEPIDKLIARRSDLYQRTKAYRDAATWQQIHVKENKPFGLALIGDPHLDDDGCAWGELLDDIQTMKETDGLYAINIGDTTNNWVGRLARLFGGQETSQTSARQLAEWFLVKAGIRWAAVLLGNHDLWNEGGDIIRRMCSRSPVEIPVHEWQAKLEFVFPNGTTCRGNFAHDFKGRSIYSTTQGPLREAIWTQHEGAHLYVAGHIHYGGLQQVELPGGQTPWLVRVRGYKDFDSHALVNGFHEGKRFRSVMAIIDPNAPEHERVTIFGNLAQGAKVLAAMRANKQPRAKRKSKAASKAAAPKPAKKSAAKSKSKKKGKR